LTQACFDIEGLATVWLAQDTWELGLNVLSSVLKCLWEVIVLLSLKNLHINRHGGGRHHEGDNIFHI
jgi:hypothetical protein